MTDASVRGVHGKGLSLDKERTCPSIISIFTRFPELRGACPIGATIEDYVRSNV